MQAQSSKDAAGWLRRAWSLRSILVTSLLVFLLLPTCLVGWILFRSNEKAVDQLSERVVQDMVRRVETYTLEHVTKAHMVFNGLIGEEANDPLAQRSRQLLLKPELFEQTAFAMTRMASNVPYLYFGSAKGEFLGVESLPGSTTQSFRVGVRKQGDEGRHFYAAEKPGDRGQTLSIEAKNYEPRSRPWYQVAMENKGRTFTPVYPSASKKQLLITLAQPVYAQDSGAIGVIAADVFLKELSQHLQSAELSANGVVFLLDEKGFLVANSTGEALYKEVKDTLERIKPDTSSNPVVRSAYALAAPDVNKTLESSVQRVSFVKRAGTGDDALIVALQPFGESIGLRWSLVVAAPESDFAGATQAALKKTVALVAGFVLLAAGLALWLAYRLSRRFQLLGHAAIQLAIGEVPAVQTDSHVREVRRLSQILHDSAHEISSSRTALQEANDTLEARVASRTAALEASREEALSAARAKAAFLATMSHEIRTPLNGVVGMTTLLADTPLNHEQSDYVHTMRVSSDQLLGVINDILDFSKIESGKLELENEPLSLMSTVEEACDMGAPRAREKGLELLVDLEDNLPMWVRGDVTRLRQILLNYINNAVKFTEKGQVLVSAHMLEEFDVSRASQPGALIEFRVKDSGIGIPEDRQSALFQSFTQVDTSTTRKYGGTGLGLAICKRLAELMGGAVGLESAPGEGSTFWFTARMGFSDSPDASHSSLLQMVSLADKHALIVDDTVLNLRILDKQLSRWGMVNTLFERAEPALEWLKTNTVDVIVTDMHMPEMDGQTFAEAVRKRTPNAHIVLLTSGTMPTGELAKAFDARMLKPYRQSQLFDALARVTSAQTATQKEAKRDAVTTKNQLILVADDNPVNLKVALAMLAKLGYEAATAMNGREAVDRVAESLRTGSGVTPRPYAAVLMDANMPVMDGFAAARQILSTHANAPPIIALTASVLEEDRQRCLAAGMLAFLPKPLRIDELAEVLARYARGPEESQFSMIDATEVIAAYADSTALNTQNSPLKVVKPMLVLMDWSRLEQFKEFDDDARSMTREVIALFAADAPVRIQDIHAALSACDSAALSRAAHALKGAASNVGAQALTDACFQIEQACMQGVWPADAGDQVANTAQLASQTLHALNDWVA